MNIFYAAIGALVIVVITFLGLIEALRAPSGWSKRLETGARFVLNAYPFQIGIEVPPRNASSESREDRVRRLSTTLGEALQLLTEIEHDIRSGQQTASRLKTDIDTYRQVAALRREEIEAVAEVVRGELRHELVRESRARLPREVVIALLAALFGAGISALVAVLIQ